MRTSKHTRRAGTAANSSAVSDFVDDFATVLSQDEPVVQEAAQHRVGTRPVDQETHARKPQSASAPASRLRRVNRGGEAIRNISELKTCRSRVVRRIR